MSGLNPVKLIFQRIKFTFGMLLQYSTPVIKKRFTGVTPTHEDLRKRPLFS